jgi:hypothetical protein
MKVIDKKTGKQIEVEWVNWGDEPFEKHEIEWIKAHNAEYDEGRFIDTNFNYYTHDELEFEVPEPEVPETKVTDNEFISDKEMTYEIAKMILNSCLEKVQPNEVSTLVKTSVDNAKKFVNLINE